MEDRLSLMKTSVFCRLAGTLLLWLGANSLGADPSVQAGQKLVPELGLYVDIDEEKWGAAQLNLRIVNNNFRMYFLDEDKSLVEPELDSAIVHYGNFIKDANARFTIVLEKEGLAFTSKRVIPPPHRYMCRIFLRKTVDPPGYYEKPYEEKEFIGMHTLNQLGGDQLYEKTHTEPESIPLPPADDANSGGSDGNGDDAG